ncbi:phosphoribosylglycinamide formyltransferase [Calycomorphotria hydatis]|uniref:Phosphoribosylglycinamide formyltransferase n=1 Tax=Calycomorphotria hydatis TaxID=2528027 RepID=A0A517T3I4_9PLAN|nr:phosphoribosylglycinamide formyltransferase [Calycomorphotria hydatis]QDT62942.1 Phosphoribosylglycinamide formyltransferase [Calycomorphotria hydatis]
MSDPESIKPLTEPLNRPIRLAALISGGGTTVINLQQKIMAGELNAEIRTVIASRPGCKGIERAQEQGLDCQVIARKEFEDVNSFSNALFEQIAAADVDLIVLAGFLSLINIPDRYRYRVMNIHPALLPAFGGKGFHGHHVHTAAVERGVKVSGCTVHFADNEYDHGPIILQRSVPVLADDTPDTLAARVFTAECTAYPEAIRLFATGRLEVVDGRRVRVGK